MVICSQFCDRKYALQVLLCNTSLLPENCDRLAECDYFGRCRRAIMREVEGEGVKEVLVDQEDIS